MNTLGNNNKHTHLATLAHLAGRVGMVLVVAFSLAFSLMGGVAQAAPSAEATIPGLGKAANFAVLSAAPNATGAVTCTDSVVNGDVGSSGDMPSITQTRCVINGEIVPLVSAKVLADFNKAYDKYSSIACTGSLPTTNASPALTLTPGVYCNTAAVTFTDFTLTLDGQGDANAVWIFKIGTGGTGALTGTNFTVVMANDGQPCNVYWWVAEAATLTTSGFQGTILAGAAITVTGLAGTTTPFDGNALAKAGVTLTNVTVTGCAGDDGCKCDKGCKHHHDGCKCDKGDKGDKDGKCDKDDKDD